MGDDKLVFAVLEDYKTAPISQAEKALFAFIEKVNRTSNKITREDIEELEQVGWLEEAIYDAVTVCALFNFYNRWIDSTGVQDMPSSSYELSGKRLREHGYAKNED